MVDQVLLSGDSQCGKATVSGGKATHNRVLSVVTQTYSVVNWPFPGGPRRSL